MEPESKGLRVIAEGSEPIVDIVFVHGLQGHPRDSWSGPRSKPQNTASLARSSGSGLFSRHRKSPKWQTAVAYAADRIFWPQELLASDFPRARIASFGYDSKIFGFFYGAGNQNSLFNHARNLVEELVALRKHDDKRKLIFVAHSMGGLIVKDVLRRSRNSGDQSRYQSLYESTYSCLFLGTPHRGSDKSDWATIIQRMATIVLIDSNKKLTGNLEPNDTALDLLREDFAQVLGDRKIRIHTFQEERGISGIKGLSGKVVEDFSSALDDSMEDRQGIDADHRDMIRFAGPDDPGYRKVKNTIGIDITDIRSRQVLSPKGGASSISKESEALLQALFFPYLQDQRYSLREPQSGTLDWLLQRPEYLECLKGTGSRLLWISGKPGSGKSTLFTRIHQEIFSEPTTLSISFVFSGTEVGLASSAIGLIRGLLYQLLVAVPFCCEEVLPLLRSNYDPEQYRFLNTLKPLCTAFKHCVQQLHGRRLILLMDALDECDTASVDFIGQLLHELIQIKPGHGAICSAVVTSRQTELIQFRLGDCLHFDVADLNGSDIDTYVTARSDKLRDLNPRQHAVVDGLMESIIKKADGCFLWVSLTLDDLERDALQGTHAEELALRLESLPSGLDGVYEKILESLFRASSQDVLETEVIFRWTILATRPLHLWEVWAVLQLHTTSHDPLSNSSKYDADAMKRRVKSRTGGLFEVVKVENRFQMLGSSKLLRRYFQCGLTSAEEIRKWAESLVTPVHFSVYTFLNSKTRGDMCPGEYNSKLSGFKVSDHDHAIIAKTCIQYIKFCLNAYKADKLSYSYYHRQPSAKEPLPYALLNWHYHAKLAERHGYSIYEYLAELATDHSNNDHSIEFRYNLADPNINATSQVATMESVAARYKLMLTLKRLVERKDNRHLENITRSNPCLAACRGNNVEGLRMLCETARLEPGLEIAEEAGSQGYLDIVKYLVDRTSDPVTRNAFIYKALHGAAGRSMSYGAGREDPEDPVEVLRFLIDERGAKVDQPLHSNHNGATTALRHAAGLGRDTVVDFLLTRGADPNWSDESDLSRHGVLQHALGATRPGVVLGYLPYASCASIVQRLLEYGADVDPPSQARAPLISAASCRNQDIVKLLLEYGADPNRQCSRSGNALHQAASKGHLPTVAMLVEAGADVSAQGGPYHSVLQAAASGRNAAVVEFLIQRGADANLEGGGIYGSPLNAACNPPNCEILCLLLEAGVRIPLRAPFYSRHYRDMAAYQSALHSALGHQNLDAVRLLLDHGASIASEDVVMVLDTASEILDVKLYTELLTHCQDRSSLDQVLIRVMQSRKSHKLSLLRDPGRWSQSSGHKTQEVSEEERYRQILEVTISAGANPNGKATFWAAIRSKLSNSKLEQLEGSALQHACSLKDYEAVGVLIAKGADVNEFTASGTALQVACELGELELVKIMLQHGAHVNVEIPFHGSHLQAVATIRCISERGQVKRSRASNEAPFRSKDYGADAIGPPQGVSGENVEAIVSLLLEAGADVNHIGGAYGSALHAAAYALNESLMKSLLDRGCTVTTVAGRYGTVLQALLCAKEVNEHQVAFRNARAEQLKITMAAQMMRKGADVKQTGGQYHTALQAAAWASNSKQLLLLLLRRGADVNTKGGWFGSALQAAAAQQNPELVELLLEWGADPNLTGGRYGSVLCAAVAMPSRGGAEQRRRCVSLLLKHGAEPNFVTADGNAPLNLEASTNRDLEVCRALIDGGCDVNLRTKSLDSPLLSLVQGFVATIETATLFHQAGADVNSRTDNGCTALHFTATSRDLKTTDFLLRQGANINAWCKCHGYIIETAITERVDIRKVNFFIGKGADLSVLEEHKRKIIQRLDLKTAGLYRLSSRLRDEKSSQAQEVEAEVLQR